MALSPYEALIEANKIKTTRTYEAESSIDGQIANSDFDGRNSILVSINELNRSVLNEVLNKYKKRGWYIKPYSHSVLQSYYEFAPTVEVKEEE